MNQPIAIVTGANRGLGFEACRQLGAKGFRVVLTARDPHKGEVAADRLKAEKIDALFHPLDVARDESVQAFADWAERKLERVDALVNNAGIFVSSDVFSPDLSAIHQSFETNTLGAYRLCQRFLPRMKRQGSGRIVNVSTGMSQLSDMDGGWPAYRISKTALNAVTRIFAAEARGTDVLVNSMCPGWVKTDMGGPGAERSVEEGADTMVWLATLPKGGPSGGFFRDRQPIEW